MIYTGKYMLVMLLACIACNVVCVQAADEEPQNDWRVECQQHYDDLLQQVNNSGAAANNEDVLSAVNQTIFDKYKYDDDGLVRDPYVFLLKMADENPDNWKDILLVAHPFLALESLGEVNAHSKDEWAKPHGAGSFNMQLVGFSNANPAGGSVYSLNSAFNTTHSQVKDKAIYDDIGSQKEYMFMTLSDDLKHTVGCGMTL